MTSTGPEAVTAAVPAPAPPPTPVLRRSELLAAAPAQALAGLLGVPLPDLEGAGLPPLWHWLYLLDRAPQADLGPDGHPVRAAIPLPPGPGRRRMFAGGRVRTLRPLRVGAPAERRTWLAGSAGKVGRSGPMTVVTVAHEITQGGEVVVSEEQDVVYLDARPTVPAAPVAGEGTPGVRWELPVDPVLLFRFSALTYNAHRIHYDREYARDVEGYPGLLVHGPLQAVAMAELARRERPDQDGPARFEYRLRSPLFDHQGMSTAVSGQTPEGLTLAVHDRSGRRTATGAISWARAPG